MRSCTPKPRKLLDTVYAVKLDIREWFETADTERSPLGAKETLYNAYHCLDLVAPFVDCYTPEQRERAAEELSQLAAHARAAGLEYASTRDRGMPLFSDLMVDWKDGIGSVLEQRHSRSWLLADEVIDVVEYLNGCPIASWYPNSSEPLDLLELAAALDEAASWILSGWSPGDVWTELDRPELDDDDDDDDSVGAIGKGVVSGTGLAIYAALYPPPGAPPAPLSVEPAPAYDWFKAGSGRFGGAKISGKLGDDTAPPLSVEPPPPVRAWTESDNPEADLRDAVDAATADTVSTRAPETYVVCDAANRDPLFGTLTDAVPPRAPGDDDVALRIARDVTEQVGKMLAAGTEKPSGVPPCKFDTDGDGNCAFHPAGCADFVAVTAHQPDVAPPAEQPAAPAYDIEAEELRDRRLALSEYAP